MTSWTTVTCSYPTCDHALRVETTGLSWDDAHEAVGAVLRQSRWAVWREEDGARYHLCATHAPLRTVTVEAMQQIAREETAQKRARIVVRFLWPLAFVYVFLLSVWYLITDKPGMRKAWVEQWKMLWKSIGTTREERR